MRKMIWIICLALVGCTTPMPRTLEHVTLGMDKDRVLENAGNPKRTFRENSQDHWIYIYFVDDKEWKREVVFEGGKAVRITDPLAKENWVKELEKASSMEEYEYKAREHQKKADDFKPVDEDSPSTGD